MHCQADFFKAQLILAKRLQVPVRRLVESEGKNVKILNDNRNDLIVALEGRLGIPCEKRYYNICGAILRGLYLYGMSEEEIVEGIDLALEPLEE